MRRSELPQIVQEALRLGSLRFGRLTSGARMGPTFLICGAQRCGTTTMYRTLRQHPGVLAPVLHKGVHYFDTSYERGPAWYRAHFPTRRTAARLARASGSPTQAFESSPYYLFHPLAASRIAKDLPGARIISLLRDPVERAYSAHAHESARGYEREPFEKALELEPSRLAGEEERLCSEPNYVSFSHQHHAYFQRGRYLRQLQHFERVVGRDRMLVIDSEDFFTDPEPVWRATLDFLELPAGDLPVFEQHNARSRSALPDSVRLRLCDAYQQDDTDLAKWWGRTPSWRR